VVSISNYIQKLPNVNGDNLTELDSHFTQAPIKLTTMGVDPETRQASLILMFYFTRKLGHWAQQNTERKKERNPLQKGPLKGIGSSVGMQPIIGGVGV
jgi:hypothetical protein